MSDRTLTVPFLVAPQSRAPATPSDWNMPSARRTPPRRESVWTIVAVAWRRYRSRLALAQLDAHLLKDIGVTYAEAEHEANKPFWRG